MQSTIRVLATWLFVRRPPSLLKQGGISYNNVGPKFGEKVNRMCIHAACDQRSHCEFVFATNDRIVNTCRMRSTIALWVCVCDQRSHCYFSSCSCVFAMYQCGNKQWKQFIFAPEILRRGWVAAFSCDLFFCKNEKLNTCIKTI